MSQGRCHLCGQTKVLKNSHVWPRMGYKRYISDHSKGGSFADLQSLSHHNRQETQRWFCGDCEQKFGEGYAGAFLSSLDKTDVEEYQYDGWLLRFAISISWRTAKYYAPRAKTKRDRDILAMPCDYWKDFLRERRRDVMPYSQHCFVAFGENQEGKDVEWHLSLGGQIFQDERLILSRVGPLVIVGLLDRTILTLSEINIWEQSRITSHGGFVKRIRKNRPESILTNDLVRVLNKYEKWCIQRAVEMAANGD